MSPFVLTVSRWPRTFSFLSFALHDTAISAGIHEVRNISAYESRIFIQKVVILLEMLEMKKFNNSYMYVQITMRFREFVIKITFICFRNLKGRRAGK